jgi:hypothetical protein
MKRTSLAALLAAPVLLAFPGITHANPPKQCFAPFGGGGVCLGIFSKLHQHGPLFNYGPYYGYPPFEPYGYWNQYLQYTGPFGGAGGYGGGHGHGHGHGYDSYAGRGGICTGGHGGMHGSWLHGGWFHGDGCGKDGLFHGHSSWLHHGSSGGDCAGCVPTAFNAYTIDPASRFAGAGAAGLSAAYYSDLPTIQPATMTPAGGFGK